MFRTPSSPQGPQKPCGTSSATNTPGQTCDPILLLLHQKKSSAGAVGAWLEHHGYRLDIKRPTLGEDLPQSLENHAGLIVFGGPMSANDETPEIKSEIDWLALALQENIPYFGICLGAQLMVRQLGGTVTPEKNGLVEVGYHPVRPTSAGRQLTSQWSDKYFQWHKEGFSLPSGAVQLASGERFEHQAFSYAKHVFGVQFHPEITKPIMRRWSLAAAHMLTKKGAHNAERLLADHQKYGAAQQDWLNQFMNHWTSLFKPR